jgi:Cu-processing system ATP-binding protein
MIHLEGVSKAYGKVQALKNCTVSFEQGQSVALIGPNGSGKTTIIKCILGMVKPDQGQITFQGNNITNHWQYRENIGYMPQTGRYPDNMRVEQVFSLLKKLRKSPHSADEELIEQFALREIFQKPMYTLSGGMRQKVSAALAFLFDPDVLILDEPTAGLDPLASEYLKQKIIQEKKKGKLILITSHILSDLDDIATDVFYIMEGHLQFFKTLEAVKAETSEVRLANAIASIMKKQNTHVPHH